jgi:hypothetical protein
MWLKFQQNLISLRGDIALSKRVGVFFGPPCKSILLCFALSAKIKTIDGSVQLGIGPGPDSVAPIIFGPGSRTDYWTKTIGPRKWTRSRCTDLKINRSRCTGPIYNDNLCFVLVTVLFAGFWSLSLGLYLFQCLPCWAAVGTKKMTICPKDRCSIRICRRRSQLWEMGACSREWTRGALSCHPSMLLSLCPFPPPLCTVVFQ